MNKERMEAAVTNTGFLKRAALRGLLCAFVFAAAATGIGTLFRLWQFPETNIVVVYILSEIGIASCRERVSEAV